MSKSSNIKVYNLFKKIINSGKNFSQTSPCSNSMPHQIHLQHHLLTCTAYTIIAKHKQIGWANNYNKHIYNIYIYIYNPSISKDHYPLIPYHMATTMSSMVYVFRRISQDVLLSHLQATTCRARTKNLLRTILCNAGWSSQYEHSL